ncbi:MAG: hypothetical protein IE891_09125 [Flavobacteriaceae bacterium]|nr:hypothetical protein [Flavobacteriaceae bacterium]
MKKNLLLLLLLFSSLSFSQAKSSNCNFNFDLTAKVSKDNLSNPKQAFVELTWDFSKIDLSKHEIKIEIVPILDCFNSLDASKLKDVIIIDINSIEYKVHDSKKFMHLDLMAKCFKYRIVITSKSCNEITPWEFCSFF